MLGRSATLASAGSIRAIVRKELPLASHVFLLSWDCRDRRLTFSHNAIHSRHIPCVSGDLNFPLWTCYIGCICGGGWRRGRFARSGGARRARSISRCSSGFVSAASVFCLLRFPLSVIRSSWHQSLKMGSRSCNACVVETYPYRIAPVMRKYMTVFLGDTTSCLLVGFEDDYVLLRCVR